MSPGCQLRPCRRPAGATAGSRPRNDEPTSASASCACAINEFFERGYHRTSVEDIVRSAHTSRNCVLYAFFDNREAAMLRGVAGIVARAARFGAHQHPRRGGKPEPDRDRHHRGSSAISCRIRLRLRSSSSKASAPRPRSTLRARVPGQVATAVRDIWVEYDPEAAASPQATAVAVGVFGLLSRSMLHLVENDRLDEGTGARARAGHRRRADARPRCLTASRPVRERRAEARHRHTGADAAPLRVQASWRGERHPSPTSLRSCRRPSVSATPAARAPSTSPSRPTSRSLLRGGRYWDPLRGRSARPARTTSTIRLLTHVLVLGYHHPLAHREALRDARRDLQRTRDPRRRCRLAARGVRSARRAVRRSW